MSFQVIVAAYEFFKMAITILVEVIDRGRSMMGPY